MNLKSVAIGACLAVAGAISSALLVGVAYPQGPATLVQLLVGGAIVSNSNPLPVTGGGGGGGAVTIADGADVAEGAKADAVCGTATGTCTVVALLKYLNTAVGSAIPAGANLIGSVQSAPNQTPTDCSGTIATGGTAQNAFAAGATKHGFLIQNLSTDILTISWNGTAGVPGTAGSYTLNAASMSAAGGSFSSPFGFGINTALSVLGATTSSAFSCTWW